MNANGSFCKIESQNFEKYVNCNNVCFRKGYDSPMLWVGLYIAGASLVCMIAFLFDLFNGFRTKKLWFPCKFFALNAAISSLLAIATKIPSDLTTPMTSLIEQFMKVFGTTLMSISLANFMPSLASMSDSELSSNLMALALLIVPLISNICIQFKTGVIEKYLIPLHVVILSCIFLQFSLLISTAIASPTMKIQLDSAYKKKATSTAKDSESISNDKELIMKHWVMSQTSNPQFGIARSVICTTSGAICLLILLLLALNILPIVIDPENSDLYHVFDFKEIIHPKSNYKWSVFFIVAAQTAAILFGSISPICRWLTVVWFKFAGWPKSSFRDLWTVEEYWTERLREMKHSRSRLNCRLLKLKKWNGRALFLNICITFQIFTIISCKFLSFISLVIFLPFLYFYKLVILLIISMKKKNTANTKKERSSEWEIKLEKEPEFPKHTIEKFVSIADGYIKKGKKKTNSMKLIKLLNKANGIEKFNLNLIESLTRITIDGIPNNRNGSWTMMVVTLSTIAVACSRECDGEFVLMVSNILPYVIYVDETVGVGSKVDNIRTDLVDVAMVVWFDVHFFRKWLKDDTKLPIVQTTTTTENNSLKEKLTILRDSSTNYIKNTTTTTTKTGDDKLRVTAAKWMNKTVEIVLEHVMIDDLSDKIAGMVADILAACLVNLSKAITIKISDTPIEKREEVVKQAACIFGETEKVREFAEKRLSSIISAAQDHKAYAEASWWKVVIKDYTKTAGSKASHVSSYDHKIEVNVDDASTFNINLTGK
ncbi:uncharacterized protein LOC124932632 [Impatiens glandulifera]|uniref:uncharacterized protein LOC124932632 n=1 Tax=Impatiens glandulifera TaxID=253017 RepID=UPI001FB152F7|nr:uncharacterized protein LOC124932632 [Impatiens glandulifera]